MCILIGMAETAKYFSPDLEKIRAMRMGSQSWQMRGLSRTHSELLGGINPDFISRYKGLPRALVNTWRLAVDPTIHAFLIYPGVEEYERPVGVATVIPEQYLNIKKGRIYVDSHSFTDVDYWVGEELHPDAHREIGERLVEYATDDRYIRPVRPLLVSAHAGEAFPEGLDERNGFTSVAQFATLTALYSDIHGVSRDGAAVDVRVRMPNAA